VILRQCIVSEEAKEKRAKIRKNKEIQVNPFFINGL
jgi:hypothetical protein